MIFLCWHTPVNKWITVLNKYGIIGVSFYEIGPIVPMLKLLVEYDNKIPSA